MKTVIKGFKYRIYPNVDQQTQLAKTFGCVRFVYNQILAKRIDLYKLENKSISKTDCNNYCNRELKKEYIWLKDVDKFALTNSIYDLDSAYQNFFREIKKSNKNQGFPKFKSKKDHYYSYKTNFTNNNIKVLFDENLVQLPKLGKIKAKIHREFKGKILFATISKTPSNKYFVSFNVEVEHEVLPESKNMIGFDLGIKEFIIDTNNVHIENPRVLKQYEDKLTKLQRQQAKMVKGSNNFKKQSIKISRTHEKITNIRHDFQHKLSSEIINKNQVIISEDLMIANMLKNHKLAKAIQDVSWGEFTRQIKYKSEWNYKIYHKISPWFASSQLCSDCGYKNKEVKCLSIREWVCTECGAVHQRDENASKNILKEGLRELGIVS
jgi:putative transposase